MRNNFIRCIIVFMVMMTVVLTATGCSKKNNKGQNQTNLSDESNQIYGCEVFISDGMEGNINFFDVRDEEIYIHTYQKKTDETMMEDKEIQEGGVDIESDTHRMYSVNFDGRDLKEISLIKLKENERIEAILVDRDKNMVYVLRLYDERGENSFVLVKADQEGKELKRKDITNDIGADEDIEDKNFLFDYSGRMILVSNQQIHIYDEDYNFLCKFELDEYINNVALTKDGHVIGGGSNENGAYVRGLDIENKKWGEDIVVDTEYFNSSDSLINGFEYDFYYWDDSGIYGYALDEMQSVKLMDYTASNIASEDLYGIVPIGQEQFIGIIHGDGGESEIVKFSHKDLSTSLNKTIITYGALEINDDLKNAAIQFNKENKEYRIEFKDYSLEEDPVTKMNMDIITGNVPDIIDLSGIPVTEYVSKGILEDLTPYLEKDTDIGEDDIVDSVLKAMKIDGKLYYLASAFSVSTIIARAKDVGNNKGWTFDDMKQLLEKKGGMARPFFMTEKTDILYLLLNNDVSSFIDWDSGACSFDSREFRDILEFCNTESIVEDDSGFLDLISGGKVLFVEGSISVEEIQVYKKLYNGDITFIGYPNRKKNGSYFYFNNMTSIYAKSENKEGAWQFIRTLMLKEYQNKQWRMTCMPTRKDCFEQKMKEKMAIEKYIDEFGNEIQPIDSVWGYYDFEVQIKPVSNEEAEMYLDLVNNTCEVGESNSFIIDIILEEAEPFFDGSKSLDEVIQIIQNRIHTYVNETR